MWGCRDQTLTNWFQMASIFFARVFDYSGWCTCNNSNLWKSLATIFYRLVPNHHYFTRGENHHPNSRGKNLNPAGRVLSEWIAGTKSQKDPFGPKPGESPKKPYILDIQLRIEDRCFSTVKGIFWESLNRGSKHLSSPTKSGWGISKANFPIGTHLSSEILGTVVV